MNQGDVYWCTRPPPDKRRPMLILTRNPAISFLTNITVAPLTTRIRNIPTEVALTPDEDGVFTECAVNLDNIQTVYKDSLDEFVTTLSVMRMREVRAARKWPVVIVVFATGSDLVTRPS